MGWWRQKQNKLKTYFVGNVLGASKDNVHKVVDHLERLVAPLIDKLDE